jgi:hypothetical protein
MEKKAMEFGLLCRGKRPVSMKYRGDGFVYFGPVLFFQVSRDKGEDVGYMMK